MKKPINPAEIVNFRSMREPLSLQAAIKESNRCLLCHDAPCSVGCPADTDPGKFIRQIRFYNYKGAARTIRTNNILGSVCALVCPVEKLCEKECSVKALEDPIDIGGLQRFAMEYGEQFGIEAPEKSKKTNGKVAVVGAGPAGMGCAAELAKLDYDVTIFERSGMAGGVPKWNIPEYRLPENAIARDVGNLLGMGVQIRYNQPIVSNDAAIELLNKGYDAVFLGNGLSKPFELKFLNDFDNAVNYIDFLREIKLDRNKWDLKDKNVAVIGGGSVAIDSAVSAKAAGAKKVYLIALEQLHELPADKEEIHLAQIMHIIFKAGSKVTDVMSKNNRIVALQGTEVEWIAPGNFSPENIRNIDGTAFTHRVDLIVQAIGTAAGEEPQNIAKGLQTKDKGIVAVNENFETNLPGIFSGGDLVNGGATVVQAVGEGKKAAQCIDNYISQRRNN
jgi:dihydropyrimidine dehydrogenase (NAD+) subunit PreT